MPTLNLEQFQLSGKIHDKKLGTLAYEQTGVELALGTDPDSGKYPLDATAVDVRLQFRRANVEGDAAKYFDQAMSAGWALGVRTPGTFFAGLLFSAMWETFEPKNSTVHQSHQTMLEANGSIGVRIYPLRTLLYLNAFGGYTGNNGKFDNKTRSYTGSGAGIALAF